MPARCALHTEGAAGHTVAISAGERHRAIRLRVLSQRSLGFAQQQRRKDPNRRGGQRGVAVPRPAFMDQLADGLAAAGIPRA
jgi:hypothetical protein